MTARDHFLWPKLGESLKIETQQQNHLFYKIVCIIVGYYQSPGVIATAQSQPQHQQKLQHNIKVG